MERKNIYHQMPQTMLMIVEVQAHQNAEILKRDHTVNKVFCFNFFVSSTMLFIVHSFCLILADALG